MINKTDFTKKLTELRNKCGLSQSRLADMLFISGQAVSKWENGNSLPDIELLLPLAQILGVSVDNLLNDNIIEDTICSNNPEIMSEAIAGFDLADEKINLLNAMSGSLSREYLYKAAKYMEKDMLEYKLYLELTSSIENTKNFYRKEIKLQTLGKNDLAPFSQSLSNLTLQAINKGYNPIVEILDLMKCPVCGKSFIYSKTSDEEYIHYGDHRFDVNDGVVDFKTLEIHGYPWSSWLRGYDDYKSKWGWPVEKAIPELESLPLSDKMIIDELSRSKPSVIIEIGTGCASGIRKFIKFNDWECIIILTDLSHRILKYDKRLIDETLSNSKIKLVYLACDIKNLPFKDDTIPCVISYGGYDSVFHDYFKPFKEVYRVLKEEGINVYTISLVTDKQNANTQKWLKLIKDSEDHDMLPYYNTIYDINEWKEKIKSFGYSQHALKKIKDELPAPDTDVFPYDCEIGRWQALAFVSAKK